MKQILPGLALSIQLTTGALSAQAEPESWAALAFEKGSFYEAMTTVTYAAGPGWAEVVELLNLTEPESRTEDFLPRPFWDGPNTAIERDRDGSIYFDSGSWPAQNYLCRRWEAWCLRYAFTGTDRKVISTIFQYLLTKLPHAHGYRPQLNRTLAELNELYDSAEGRGLENLQECLEQGATFGWWVVESGEKVEEEDLARHALESDKPVVLLPGASLVIPIGGAFTIPSSCELWVPRGLRIKMPTGSRLDLGGRVLTYGDEDEAVRFIPRRGAWSGIRIVASTPGTTWLQDWEVRGARMGIQIPISGHVPVTIHGARLLGCEIGIGGSYTTTPDGLSAVGTGSRLFLHECRVEDAGTAGLVIGGRVHGVSCEIKDAGTGIIFSQYGGGIMAGTRIHADIPIDVQVPHPCLLAIRCTLTPRVRNGARIRVLSSNQLTLERNHWASRTFRDRYISYSGQPTDEPLSLGVDSSPLAREPEGDLVLR